jgi:NAD+ synthase (glutamine-hydrolysing)
MAWNAWRDAAFGSWPETIPHSERVAYDLSTIVRWLELFLKRFFGTSQFKRSAMPNGPKRRDGEILRSAARAARPRVLAYETPGSHRRAI